MILVLVIGFNLNAQNFFWGLETNFLVYGKNYLQDYTLIKSEELKIYYEIVSFDNQGLKVDDRYDYVYRDYKKFENSIYFTGNWFFGKKKRRLIKPFNIQGKIGYINTNTYFQNPNVVYSEIGDIIQWGAKGVDYTKHSLDAAEFGATFLWSVYQNQNFNLGLSFGISKRYLINQNSVSARDIGEIETELDYTVYNSLPWFYTFGFSPGWVFTNYKSKKSTHLYLPISFAWYSLGIQNEEYWDNKFSSYVRSRPGFKDDYYVVREKRGYGFSINVGIGVKFGNKKRK